jgi:hypothetical protein
MASPKRYQYTPLPSGEFGEIRLLVLHPYGSNPSSALFGSLTSARVFYSNRPPPYDALSYAWGSNDQSERLNICDRLTEPAIESRSLLPFLGSWWGKSSSDITPHGVPYPDASYIPITPNLHSALKRLRQKTAPRVLWVDRRCRGRTPFPVLRSLMIFSRDNVQLISPETFSYRAITDSPVL